MRFVRAACCLVGTLAWVAFAPACGDPQAGVEQAPAGEHRPLSDPGGDVPPFEVPGPVVSEAGASDRSLTSIPGVAYYRLVLLSGADAPRPAGGVEYVALAQSRAGDVGRLLEIIYVPTGPTGTDDRYTLMYPTRTELTAAVGWAKALDFPVIEADVQAGPQGGEACTIFALGVLYGTSEGHPQAMRRYRLAIECFTRALHDADVDITYRWVSGVMAGWLLNEYFGDVDGAEQRLVAAQKLTPEGAYERMVTLYQRARVSVAAGRADQARVLLAVIMDKYAVISASETYQRARRLLDALPL
jgi:hypothetical protein